MHTVTRASKRSTRESEATRMNKTVEKPAAGRGKRKSHAQLVWHQFKKNKGSMLGLCFFILLAIGAVAAAFFVDYETQIAGIDVLNKLKKPSMEHWFGTDHMGRDVFLRVIYGAQYSLVIGIIGTIISTIVGVLMGAIAGYYGGQAENLIMRFCDVLMTIPSLLMAVCVVAALGISLPNLIIAMGVCTIPNFARTTRASVMTVRGNEYVEAARAIGASELSILFKHVLPNALSPIIVQATGRVATCITGAASFSFLGLGVPAPLPEWGAMLSDAKPFMRSYPYLMIFPGLAIALTVLSINLIGDGLRDALDPKLKR